MLSFGEQLAQLQREGLKKHAPASKREAASSAVKGLSKDFKAEETRPKGGKPSRQSNRPLANGRPPKDSLGKAQKKERPTVLNGARTESLAGRRRSRTDVEMEDRLGVKDSFFDDDDEDEAPLGSRKSVLGGRMKGKASMGSDSEESGLESRERSGDENYGSDPGSDEDSDEAADPKASSRASKRKKVHKDKSRPAELSSKKAVGRARIVVKTGEVKRRDPRFDDRTGNFNNGVFANSYNFVFDLHKKEMSELRQKISVEKDPEERGRLKQLLTSLQSRDKARQAEEAKQKIKREWRKKQSERVKQGKKPFFLKDSDIKRIELMEQFRKTNPKDLERKLEKRRKHNASKDHKRMPYARNQD